MKRPFLTVTQFNETGSRVENYIPSQSLEAVAAFDWYYTFQIYVATIQAQAALKRAIVLSHVMPFNETKRNNGKVNPHCHGIKKVPTVGIIESFLDVKAHKHHMLSNR